MRLAIALLLGLEATAALAQEAPPARRELVQWDSVEALAFSPDGKLLHAGMESGRLCTWEVASGEAPLFGLDSLATCAHGGALLFVGHTGQDLVTASGDRTVCVVGKERRRLTTEAMPRAGAISPDGKTLALLARGDDGLQLLRLELPAGKELVATSLAASGPDRGAVAWSPDSELLAVAGAKEDDRGQLTLWSRRSGETRQVVLPGDDPIYLSAVAFTRDGRTVLVGDGAGVLRWLPLDGGAPLRAVEEPLGQFAARAHEPPRAIVALALSGDGALVATGSRQGVVRLLKASTGELVATLEDGPTGITSLAFSPDGRVLAAGTTRGSALLLAVPQ